MSARLIDEEENTPTQVMTRAMAFSGIISLKSSGKSCARQFFLI
jgi:hypothetical protein